MQQITDVLDNPDVIFYSFEQTLSIDDKAWLEQNKIVDLSSQLTHFAQTGAFIQKMDWVIYVDSASAHMAGALGINTVVLLADWHWINIKGIASGTRQSEYNNSNRAVGQTHLIIAIG